MVVVCNPSRSLVAMDVSLLSFLLISAFEMSSAIVLRELGVPAFAVAGKEAVLSCNYDLEGSALYSVKWYKNGLEFFRYLPGNPEPITVYARPGVEVLRDQSDRRNVHLRQLTAMSTGRYRCEVSTEGPSFATVSSYGDMIVVLLPDHEPVISGGQERYEVGDMVDVMCVSGAGKPAPDLTWEINNEPVQDSQLVRHPVEREGSLFRSRLGLRFEVDERHLQPKEKQLETKTNALELKCNAHIDTVYKESSEEVPHKQKRASNTMDMAMSDKANSHLSSPILLLFLTLAIFSSSSTT